MNIILNIVNEMCVGAYSKSNSVEHEVGTQAPRIAYRETNRFACLFKLHWTHKITALSSRAGGDYFWIDFTSSSHRQAVIR